ncbi:hypothetical protein EIP86_001215 [Pleurotus ostreatoroseus]|nr:hypothetical protein EIP86_001215 [Pleurotus ostreatoroseus]
MYYLTPFPLVLGLAFFVVVGAILKTRGPSTGVLAFDRKMHSLPAPEALLSVLAVTASIVLVATGLSTLGVALDRKPLSLLMSPFRRTARFTALCALLITTGCLSFLLASLVVTHTLQLIVSASLFPQAVRSLAHAALVPPYAPNDFFTVARCLICWITLEIPIQVYHGYGHSSTPTASTIQTVDAEEQDQTILSLQEELTRVRNLATNCEREHEAQSRAHMLVLLAVDAKHRQNQEQLSRIAASWKQRAASHSAAEHSLLLQFGRQLEVTALQAAGYDQHISLLQARINGLHTQIGALQATNDDLRSANDLLQLDLESHKDLRASEGADLHEQVSSLFDQFTHLQLANAHLQDKLDDAQDAREREFADRCSENDRLRNQNAALVAELEDRAAVEEALREDIHRVYAREAVTLVSIGMSGCHHNILTPNDSHN